MDKQTVNRVTDVGIAVNVAAGHVGEMAGKAVQAAAKTVGCRAGEVAGRAVEAAGKAWSETAVSVGNRDRGRLTGKTR